MDGHDKTAKVRAFDLEIVNAKKNNYFHLSEFIDD